MNCSAVFLSKQETIQSADSTSIFRRQAGKVLVFASVPKYIDASSSQAGMLPKSLINRRHVATPRPFSTLPESDYD